MHDSSLVPRLPDLFNVCTKAPKAGNGSGAIKHLLLGRLQVHIAYYMYLHIRWYRGPLGPDHAMIVTNQFTISLQWHKKYKICVVISRKLS